jgi:hypothetical protein
LTSSWIALTPVAFFRVLRTCKMSHFFHYLVQLNLVKNQR